MTDLETICEYALYEDQEILGNGKSVVRDPSTGKLYFKKTLSVYNISVFSWLKEHPHPNLPVIEFFWEQDDKLIVIEEYLQGNTLEQVLQKTGSSSVLLDSGGETEDSSGTMKKQSAIVLNPAKRKDILLAICDGLIYLHGAKPPIIHRDLKASNIMLTDDGNVKIIDYDAAKVYVTDEDKDTVLIGTHGIAAPEQYGFAQSDERTDIYALGKLIERLFPDEEDAADIAEKATQMDPSRRYASVVQMKHQIEKMNCSAGGRSFWRKIPGFGSRKLSHRIFAWLVTVAVFVLIGLGLYYRMVYPIIKVKQPAYELGLEYMENEWYNAAVFQFEICGYDYKDSADQIDRCLEIIISKIYNMDLENNEADFSPVDDLVYTFSYDDLDEEQKQEFRDAVTTGFVYMIESGEAEQAEERVDLYTEFMEHEDLWKELLQEAKENIY